MQPETTRKIQTLIQNLLEKAGCSVSVDFIEYPENLFFTVHTPDGGILIGESGERIRALNYIVRRMAEKTFPDESGELRFFVDVNDYQKQRIDELKDLARLSAQRVRYFKKEIEMKPMSAYDRRIIHSALSEYPDISTQSAGEGPERRVVIKPL